MTFSILKLSIKGLFVTLLCLIMLHVGRIYNNAECHYAECRYAECHYAKCRYADCCGANLIHSKSFCNEKNDATVCRSFTKGFLSYRGETPLAKAVNNLQL